ncbi:hypothetical protein AB0M95_01490 [Sphaerisporangium sp. NPDC051017]|uniref:hypothetical protein n=1 Tax=Sphaerisporangium sp. NPDC051017 TaxID=3154636 RepID=UPI003447657C
MQKSHELRDQGLKDEGWEEVKNAAALINMTPSCYSDIEIAEARKLLPVDWPQFKRNE